MCKCQWAGLVVSLLLVLQDSSVSWASAAVSLETWFVFPPENKYLSHVTCFSATGSTAHISLFPVPPCFLLLVFIVSLLGFSFWNHLITVPVPGWSNLYVYLTMTEQKWIALVFFLFGYFFSPASDKRTQRLPSILLSAMLHKIWNIKQVIYMV